MSNSRGKNTVLKQYMLPKRKAFLIFYFGSKFDNPHRELLFNISKHRMTFNSINWIGKQPTSTQVSTPILTPLSFCSGIQSILSPFFFPLSYYLHQWFVSRVAQHRWCVQLLLSPLAKQSWKLIDLVWR